RSLLLLLKYTATSEIYSLSLHDALPICLLRCTRDLELFGIHTRLIAVNFIADQRYAPQSFHHIEIYPRPYKACFALVITFRLFFQCRSFDTLDKLVQVAYEGVIIHSPDIVSIILHIVRPAIRKSRLVEQCEGTWVA